MTGFQCVFCPSEYAGDEESEALCQLWEEVLKVENAVNMVTVPDPSPVLCPYTAEKLCELHCQLQAYSGHYCCPEEHLQDPEGVLLCQLWAELQQLEEENGPSSPADVPLMPVDCPHENNPTSGQKLCSLWCEIQHHQGSRCIECPDRYTSDPERLLICDLWSELEMINFNIVSAGSITTLTPTLNVTCVYSDHLMSSDLLCEVWCMIQATRGIEICYT